MFAAKLNFTELFSGMSVMVFVCLIAGLTLIITDFYQPTKGLASGCGAAALALGLTLRMLSGGTIGMLFVLTAIIAAVLFAAHAIMLKVHKRLWLYQSLEQNRLRGVKGNYGFLIGLEGVTTTEVAPLGHMSINEVNFFVTSQEIIGKGERVRVTEVEGDKIIVKRSSQPESEEKTTFQSGV